jgi:hypothetical protein
MGALLSVSLRSLLWLPRSPSFVSAFFYGVQSSGSDGFVQCVRQYLCLHRHLRHAPAFIQQLLRPLLHFRREHRGAPPPPLAEEAFRSVLPMHLHISLDRRQRHSKRLHNIGLPHRPIGDQLTGEQPETLHVLLLVLKHRQVTVEIDHFSVLPLERNVIGNGSQPRWENRQLQLWHGSVSLAVTASGNPVSARFIFLASA